MITLKAPIELKNRTDFVKDHEAFGERIAGNYSLIGLEIGAEELLHIVSSPPEIYVAEGGATTIVGNTLFTSRNEEKLDIINNMLNRIMLSVNTELSYQDRAYITDALYKIGIRDDRKFMSEVRQMMEESRLEEEFINDYRQQESTIIPKRLSRYREKRALPLADEREILRETLSTLREASVQSESETIRREGAEIILRETEGITPETETEGRLTERIRESVSYEARNIYERELRSERLKEAAVTETINAAVLFDIVKNLYHTGYERITRSNAWTEYRGALYRSSENTINRVGYTTYESNPVTRVSEINEGDTALSLDYTEFEELSEIQENEGNIELIENQIRQMNEMNLANVSRYEQMREILKQLTPERRSTGGRERTRRDALRAIEDERAILLSLEEGEGVQEERRREVFHEITRLFPDNAAQVFNVIEQYLENPEAVRDMNIVSGNVEQAAEEIMRIQQAAERAAEPEIPEEIPPVEEGLVFRREDRLTQDELTEILDTYRRNESRQRQETESNREISETRNLSTTTLTQNTERNLTERELENIEDLVNRGVRSQMGAISEQVLTKLEKRLRNEKSRRGL